MKIQLTKEFYDEKVQKIERLEKIDIPANSKAIADAREKGDLSENAEYQEAKELQAKLHHELLILKHQIENAEIIEEDQDTSFVKIGHTITLNIKNGKQKIEKKLKLVGEWDRKVTSTSSESLLGSNLIGKHVGDKFEIKPEIGILEVTVLAIE